MQGGPTPSLRTALTSQSLTAVREGFSATWPKPDEDTAGEFPSASFEPEVGQDRGLSEGITRNSGGWVEFASSINKRVTNRKFGRNATESIQGVFCDFHLGLAGRLVPIPDLFARVGHIDRLPIRFGAR